MFDINQFAAWALDRGVKLTLTDAMYVEGALQGNTAVAYVRQAKKELLTELMEEYYGLEKDREDQRTED